MKSIIRPLFIVFSIPFYIFITSCGNSHSKSAVLNCFSSTLELEISNKTSTVKNFGTAFCAFKQDVVVTCAHLFNEANDDSYTIKGTLIDGTTCALSLLYLDQENDIALLKNSISLSPLSIQQFCYYLDSVFLIGNTYGYGLNIKQGVVSSPSKTLNINHQILRVLQTDITINSGDSGAPMLNEAGELIGMASFKLKDSNGIGIDGMSFSVLSDNLINAFNLYESTIIL